jgi:ribosomal protein S18 acetylase RimI-like enzyme
MSGMEDTLDADWLDAARAHTGVTGHTTTSSAVAGAAASPLVRRYRPEDSNSVRRIWQDGLLGNTVELAYPPGLVAEEEAFVAATLASGDLSGDIRGAYTDPTRGLPNFWVAELDGAVVGMVGMRAAPVRAGGTDSVDVSRLGVDREFRHRGVGRALLTALETAAWAGNHRAITATTSSLNTPAVALYRACGYLEVYRGRKDGKEGEPPFVRMERASPSSVGAP